MPIVTPRNVAMRDGKFEVTVYRGTTDDRTEFGVSAKALVDQNNDWEHWLGSKRVNINDKFRRAVSGWNGTQWTSVETWQHISAAEYVAGEPVRFNPSVEATPAAGAGMVDPTGLPIWIDEDGDGKAATQPAQPASGAPGGRHRWLGTLTGQNQP